LLLEYVKVPKSSYLSYLSYLLLSYWSTILVQ
jgi:hypothetical protein